MKVMRFAAAAVALLAAPVAAQDPMPTGQQVVDRYVEAIGGREKAMSFHSRTLQYQMAVAGTTMDMTVRMRRPGLGTVTMSTPMGQMRTGTDGQTVWAIGPDGTAQVLDGTQAEDVRLRTAFDADILFDIYPTMETVGREEYNGRPCWKVRMVTPVGTETHRCFDVETGLMVAVTQSQMGMEVTAIFDEYKEVDGLKYPARSTASAMGTEVVTTLLSVSHADIPEPEFAVPAEVRALNP